MDIFNIINRSSSEVCLIDDELYLEEGKWFRWDRIQAYPLDVALLKEIYGDILSITVNFIGKILIKAGISAEGKSFVWCGEKTIASNTFSVGRCDIDLSRCSYGTLEITLYALEESIVYGDYPIATETEIRPEQVLYNFISPTYELCCEEPLYYRFTGEHAYYSFEDGHVHLEKDSVVDLLTYFNGFSAVKWHKYTNIHNLSIFVDFIGEAQAEVIHVSEKGGEIFAVWNLKAKHRATLELPLGAYPESGIIGLRIHAKHKCVLYGGGYLTDAPETQPVHLGIGITTYHREVAVKSSVERLGKAIAAHPLYHDAISITVVDNGQTLIPEDVPAANLIPNKNLGGTGGFMRSLIHYQDEGIYTHCLFMDDDASCEVGSIFRSVSFIKHITDPTIAISGAMLSENIQFIQWENGAWFDSCCHPIHCNYDLRRTDILLENECEKISQAIYGAWWFFMFPIKQVKMYSFPFFIRGDDIEFSYTNNFNIIRMNGIAVWQEDFKTKESPMTLYLDIRSHILHHLALEHIDHGRWQILNMVWRFFKIFNWSYQYDTANSIALSFFDTLQGPKYWLDNIDLKKIIIKIKKQYKIESPQPLRINYQDILEATENIRLPFYTKIIRRLSLNGHLLPKFMIHNELVRLDKFKTPLINRMFLRSKVLVYNKINKTEIILTRNTNYFIKNIFIFLLTSICFIIKYKSLKKTYRKFFLNLNNNNFWKKIYN